MGEGKLLGRGDWELWTMASMGIRHSFLTIVLGLQFSNSVDADVWPFSLVLRKIGGSLAAAIGGSRICCCGARRCILYELALQDLYVSYNGYSGLPACPSIHSSASICPSVCLSICLSVCLQASAGIFQSSRIAAGLEPDASRLPAEEAPPLPLPLPQPAPPPPPPADTANDDSHGVVSKWTLPDEQDKCAGADVPI
jgi:hypothetical protein